MDKKNHIDINYIFFGIFLVISIIIASLEVLEIKPSPLYPKAFFLIYAYGQTILEIFILALAGWFIKKKLPGFVYKIFLSLFFILSISHIIDFVMLKIMDMSFWEGLDLVLDESLENFIEMLHATGIPFFAWIIFGIIAMFLPFIGLGIYKICDKISKKRKLPLHHDHFIQIFFCIPLALLIWDFKASSTINPNLYAGLSRMLPWKITFVQPNILTIDQTMTLKKPMKEEDVLRIIDEKNPQIEKKPNIYIFVIESLRNDFITKDIAPNLFKFKNENISFEKSLANANATPISWFSLFYSDFPYLWKYYKDKNWQSGAVGLNILKKMGYKINVFSSPELKYYAMKDLLFGKNNHLTNSFNLYPHYSPIEPCDSDKNAIFAMEKALETDQNVYIGFLDSTHFLYSWPKDFEIKFKPIADVEYMNAYASKDNISLIINRYKNSINFVDSLLSSFFDKLKEKNLWDDSIIIVVGDHGEEFYEEGHLFHASHLSAVQTNIPILLKMGKNDRVIPKRKLISHMNVFPSILDYIIGKNLYGEILSGESIYEPQKFNYVVTTRYNGSRTPYEFFIHSENEKLTLKFKNKKEIFKNQHLEILSLKDGDDKELNMPSKEKILEPFEGAIDQIFNK
ncbi:MAG: sulfatase-like hydrolase/transferase [Parachlamydiales bacterium]|jgi:glucan phosphoethanolaminetransferase (alkaline phosphatase superfamily)